MGLWSLLRRAEKRAVIPLAGACIGDVDGMRGAFCGDHLLDAAGTAVAERCRAIVSQSLAAVPVLILRRSGRGRTEVRDHPLVRVLGDESSPGVSSFTFREAITRDVCRFGNGVAEILRSGTGEVEALLHMPWRRVLPEALPSGRYRYRYTDHLGRERLLLQSEVMHIRYAYKDDPFWGVDPLTWAATSTALVAEQAGLARDQVRRGFASDVVFQSKTAVFGDDNLANAAFNRLKTQLRDAWHRMTRGGDPILLEGGYEARVISQSGREAQFHENLLTGLEDIARAFGVPGSLVNLNKSQSYGSMAEDARSLVRTCLAPWSTWLQTEMQVALLTREERAAGLEIVLDLSGLMRGDSEAEFKAVTAAVTAGVLSPNEGRDWFGYNPKDGGDEILRPMNMEAASNA